MEKHVITNSEITTYTSCQQLHEWRYVLGLRPVTPVAPSTLIGTAIHRAKEVHYGPENETLPWKRAVLAIFEDFLAHRPEMRQEDVDKYVDAGVLAVKVFERYLEHWKGRDPETATHPRTKAPLVEMEGEIPIYTPAGRASKIQAFRFKCDRIILVDGEYWIEETKTRDAIDATENDAGGPDVARSSFSRLLLDQQARRYSFAAQVYLGVPIAGVCYDLIRRKLPSRPSVNKDGTVSRQKCDTTTEIFSATLQDQDAFLKGLSDEARKAGKYAKGLDWESYQPELARLENVQWFARSFQRFTQDDYRAVQRELYQAAIDLHQCRFPIKNDRACDHWGGCRYKALCLTNAPDGLFRWTGKKHTELDMKPCHKPRGKPFLNERGALLDQPIGFDALLDIVNPSAN